MALLQDAAAAAVAALEADQAANSNGKDTETGEEEEEDDDDDSPITVTVTSGSTQYIAMAGTVISILLLNSRETKRKREAGKERERGLLFIQFEIWSSQLVAWIQCQQQLSLSLFLLDNLLSLSLPAGC